MKRKNLLPVILISISLLGLASTVYLLLSSESLDIREEASGSRTVTVCSSGCDYTDINQAFASAEDNDVIHLKTSEYTSGGVISRGSGWDLKLPDSVSTLTIKGNGIDQTTWKLTSSTPNGHTLHIEYLNGLTLNIKDMSFDQNPYENSIIHIYGTDTDGDSDDNANTSCTFNFNNIRVLNGKAAGIYISGDNTSVIKNSYFSANHWPGISVHGDSEVEIYNSSFIDHIHAGIDLKDSSTTKIVNNVITNNNGGIELFGSSNINELKNNIITSNNNTTADNVAGIRAEGSFDGTINNLNYNNVWNNTAGDYDNVTKGTNDISSDPLLVSDSDYHLQTGSPCIDSGDPSDSYNDLDGSRNDMGIYGGPFASESSTPDTSLYIIDHDSLDSDLIPQIYLDAIREYDIVFNHKSVGNNILDGLGSLKEQNSTKYDITIKSSPDASWFDENSGIGEYEEGSNSDPNSKVNGFKDLMTNLQTDMNDYSDKLDIAFMKFCYVDNTSSASEIWKSYKDAMLHLENSYPEIEFVWWTMPLKTEGDDIRYEYNKLVRGYITEHNNNSSDKKFLFDIAAIESHDPNGNLIKDGINEIMYSGYSSDGGHLNEDGQERVARGLWMLFARIAGYETQSIIDPQNACANADVWGNEGVPDGIVNMFDLSKILGKWKTDSQTEDISGPNHTPDGIVNLWDVIRITQTCWKKEV